MQAAILKKKQIAKLFCIPLNYINMDLKKWWYLILHNTSLVGEFGKFCGDTLFRFLLYKYPPFLLTLAMSRKSFIQMSD